MEFSEGDDHPNIDDRDLPFKFASNDESLDGTAGANASRTSHPIYKYVTRTATEWSCKTCERVFKGPRLFNITRHFKRSHPEVFAEAETLKHSDDVASYLAPFISAATNGRMASPSASSGCTSTILSHHPYEAPKLPSKPSSSKKIRNDNSTKLIVGAQNCVVSLVSSGVLPSNILENEDFSRLLSMIPGYSAPNTKEVECLVEQEVMRMYSKIAQLLDPNSAHLSSIALSVDVQERSESRPGYIAVFGHYYSLQANSFEKLLIDIVENPDNHRKNLVSATVNKILRRYNLSVDKPKISRVTTLASPRREPKYRKPYINLFTDQCGTQRELDESDYCTVSCCPERLTVIPNLHERLKIRAGLEQEQLNKNSFDWVGSSSSDPSKHILCAAQLMDEVMANVFQDDRDVSSAVNSMMNIFEKLTSSLDYMKLIMERTNGNELRIPTNNRWSSVLGSLDRFLTIAPQIEAFCKSNDWAFLSNDDLELINKINTITNPIVRFTDRLQATDSPTISLLLPGLIKLIEHLKKNGIETSSKYATSLVSQIEESFAHVLHSGEPNEDPIYLVSTLLDRRVAHMIVECDTRKQRKAIMTTISKMFPEFREKCETVGNEIVLEDSSPFGFGTVASAISVPPATSLEGSEIMPYFHRYVRLPTSSSSIEFWMENVEEFPVLSKVALAVLSIPASTIQLNSSIAVMNERLANQLDTLQSTILPKSLCSNLFLTFNKSLSKDDLHSANGDRSDASSSPTERVQRRNKTVRPIKQEPESNDEMDSTSTNSWTVKQEEGEDSSPNHKVRRTQIDGRRLSSVSSKSSGNGCR